MYILGETQKTKDGITWHISTYNVPQAQKLTVSYSLINTSSIPIYLQHMDFYTNSYNFLTM